MEEDIYVDPDYWRVFRHPAHGLCLGVMVSGSASFAMYERVMRLLPEEEQWVTACNWRELGYHALRLAKWPDQFADRLVSG